VSTIIRIAFLLLLTSFTSCENFSWLPKDVKKNGRKEKIVNGLKKTYYPNGKPYVEIEYKDGMRHGLAKSYYRSGKHYLEIAYLLGKKEGTSKMYWESGKLRRTTPYANGKKNGVRKSYFTNGKLSSTLTYKNDLPATDRKYFDEALLRPIQGGDLNITLEKGYSVIKISRLLAG